jgi:glycosyltransferase involved in cell wall biosynthesis
MSATIPSGPSPAGSRPHVILLAIGFPPAAKSSAYRMRETANQFCAAGWDVTAVTIARESWERDSGIDPTLMERVDPRVRIVELPLSRADLETDIRRYDEERAIHPHRWVTRLRARQQESFPEPNFGDWREPLEEAVLALHRERPAGLLVASCAPYVTLAAARRLWREAGVPYAVDFRDGWSIDVISGLESFTPESPAGRWESEVLADALALWVVNDPIAAHYRTRYPALADRVRVVRNGYDAESAPAAPRTADPAAGLVFGYLGTVNFTPAHLESVLAAWRLAREREPLLAGARFEVRGHIGNGAGREANRHAELLRRAAADGVRFGGPVPKAAVASVYAGWDALVLVLVGGRCVTSGKVYEYMAAGLPIVSAHAAEHDASAVLDGHPLWTGAAGLDPEPLAAALARAARLAVEAPAGLRAAAAAHAAGYARGALMAVAVRELTAGLPAARTGHDAPGATALHPAAAAPPPGGPRDRADTPGPHPAAPRTATGRGVPA